MISYPYFLSLLNRIQITSFVNAQKLSKTPTSDVGVAKLITPEEMANPNCDELSMMTYLSQFPKAQLKPGAPIKPKTPKWVQTIQTCLYLLKMIIRSKTPKWVQTIEMCLYL